MRKTREEETNFEYISQALFLTCVPHQQLLAFPLISMFINCVYISVEQNTLFLVLYEPTFLKGMMYCPELLQVVTQPAPVRGKLGQFECASLKSLITKRELNVRRC